MDAASELVAAGGDPLLLRAASAIHAAFFAAACIGLVAPAVAAS